MELETYDRVLSSIFVLDVHFQFDRLVVGQPEDPGNLGGLPFTD